LEGCLRFDGSGVLQGFLKMLCMGFICQRTEDRPAEHLGMAEHQRLQSRPTALPSHPLARRRPPCAQKIINNAVTIIINPVGKFLSVGADRRYLVIAIRSRRTAGI